MNSDLQNSVVLITGSRSNDSGTGFVIRRDDYSSYVITCAHVVRAVGGGEDIKAGSLAATVIACGEEDSHLDLAVLQVEELALPPLTLQAFGEKEKPFIAYGFQRYGRLYKTSPIRGKLGDQARLESRVQTGRIKAWNLNVDDGYTLESGYSGAPVLDPSSRQVMGIISHKKGGGDKGLAISVEVLKEIWPEMPPELLIDLNNIRAELAKLLTIPPDKLITLRNQANNLEFEMPIEAGRRLFTLHEKNDLLIQSLNIQSVQLISEQFSQDTTFLDSDLDKDSPTVSTPDDHPFRVSLVGTAIQGFKNTLKLIVENTSSTTYRGVDISLKASSGHILFDKQNYYIPRLIARKKVSSPIIFKAAEAGIYPIKVIGNSKRPQLRTEGLLNVTLQLTICPPPRTSIIEIEYI